MRQRELNRRAARRIGVSRTLMARCIAAWIREAEDLLVSGEPISLSPLGHLQPIELAEDRRRKRRGVKFNASPHLIDMMGRLQTEQGLLTLGPITRVNWGEEW